MATLLDAMISLAFVVIYVALVYDMVAVFLPRFAARKDGDHNREGTEP
jgi:hypothetical protein